MIEKNFEKIGVLWNTVTKIKELYQNPEFGKKEEEEKDADILNQNEIQVDSKRESSQ